MTDSEINQLITIVILIFGSGAFVLASALQIKEAKRAILNRDFSRWPKTCLVLILLSNGAFIFGVVIVVTYFLLKIP